MNGKILKAWISVRESMWLVPATMTIVSAILAFLLIEVDKESIRALNLSWLLYGGNPEGARSLLSTIAASMITIAGVVFSMTLVVLTLASSQYGPRLLRNFIKDKGNQLVLGTFVATFVYSLILLLFIRGGDEENSFVPKIAVAFAFVLALCSLGVLIYFIHHTSVSIQADNIIKSAYNDLIKTINQLSGQKNNTPAGKDEIRKLEENGKYHTAHIAFEDAGYLQAVNVKALLAITEKHNLVIRLGHYIGDFILPNENIAIVYRENETIDDQVVNEIEKHIISGSQRTPTQDIAFPINQVSEIAVRALSPGVNDPYTAITCIHWLGAALSKFCNVEFPAPVHFDASGRVRLIVRTYSFSQLLKISFDPIRRYAAGEIDVSVKMLAVLRALRYKMTEGADLMAIADMGKAILSINEDKIKDKAELQPLREEYQKLLEADALAGPTDN